MADRATPGTTKVGLFVAAAALTLILALQGRSAPGDAQSSEKPLDKFISLNKKFEGMKTCNTANCHDGAAGPRVQFGSECAIWQQKDQHSKAFDSLATPDAAKFAAALGIADVTTSDKCISCHAVSVPANLRGADYDATLKEGVTCAACHGPSENWRGPHSAKVNGQPWAVAQRKNLNPAAMLAQFGFNDTKDLVTRADNCTKCHLAIDASLVTAGHPQPAFELDHFASKQPKHWTDPAGYFVVKEWAAGQIVCLRDSMKQLADRAGAGNVNDPLKQAYSQAMSYGELVPMIFDAQGTDQPQMKDNLTQLKAAMAVGNAGGIQKQASAISAAADGMLKSVDAINPEVKMTTQLLKSVAADTNLAGAYGRRGAEQQEYALWWLDSGYLAGEKIAPAGNPVRAAITPLFQIVKWEDQHKPIDDAALQKFAGGVAAVKAALAQP